MKNQTFISFMALLLLASVTFIGCNNGGESSQDTQALTESDFFNNPNLSANPEGGVVVVFLEPPEAAEVDNLTGGVGFDEIPITYTRTLNHTICWEDDNVDSAHFMILLNSDGEEVLKVTANGGCVTVVIEQGDYVMVLTHGGHVDGIDPIFLIPRNGGAQVTESEGFEQREIRAAGGFSSKTHRYLPGGLIKFFESISNVFSRPARAQSTGTLSDDDFTTLIQTKNCPGCNLTGAGLSFIVLPGADLTGADLSEADLSNADLTGATLTFANLSGANLSGADLSGAILFESLLNDANLSGANLSGVDLRGSELNDADLTGANLSNALLSNADLPGADLTGADLSGADLEFADLTGATWINGGTCDFTSEGACNISDVNASPCDSLTQSGNIIKCRLPSVVTEVCEDPCPIDPGAFIPEGCGECTLTDPADLVISVDLVEIFHQANSAFSLDLDVDTPIAILAWGGEGGLGSNGLFTSGGDGGASGFASTVTTVSGFADSFGQTSFFFYLAEAGTLSNVCGDGGASTLVMLVEDSPGSLDDVVLIAGGGGGGEDGGTLSDGNDGGDGGIAPASVIGMGFIGEGQGVPDGADGGFNGVGGSGGSSDADGKDGIGGEGGKGFLGVNSQWLNGDPGVGSNGRGGNSSDSGEGCAGGGGGYGGGGGASTSFFGGESGAGGGSWAFTPTSSCATAPNLSFIPSNPGTIAVDLFGNHNGAVEVWIFTGGC